MSAFCYPFRDGVESGGDAGLCQSCGKAPAQSLHSCPYQEDVNNDKEYRCNCCQDCLESCAQDI